MFCYLISLDSGEKGFERYTGFLLVCKLLSFELEFVAVKYYQVLLRFTTEFQDQSFEVGLDYL